MPSNAVQRDKLRLPPLLCHTSSHPIWQGTPASSNRYIGHSMLQVVTSCIAKGLGSTNGTDPITPRTPSAHDPLLPFQPSSGPAHLTAQPACQLARLPACPSSYQPDLQQVVVVTANSQRPILFIFWTCLLPSHLHRQSHTTTTSSLAHTHINSSPTSTHIQSEVSNQGQLSPSSCASC